MRSAVDSRWAPFVVVVLAAHVVGVGCGGTEVDGSPDFDPVMPFPNSGGASQVMNQGGNSSFSGSGGRVSEGMGGDLPVAGQGGNAALGGSSNQGGAQNAGGGSGGSEGNPALRVGRVGAELCPDGPFGSPLPQSPQIVARASVGANDFFVWEGVVWTGEELFFSEIGNGNASQISRFTLDGQYQRGAFPNSGSNGLALDADGNLLLAAHDVGGISRVDLTSGTLTRGNQKLEGIAFNSPNDLVLRSDGNLYFTDPSFQSPGGRIGATRAYRIDPAGVISIVEDEVSNPNGITLSPDGDDLYISGSGVVRQYLLDTEGAATFVREFTTRLETADGMAMDCAGNVYAVDNSARMIRVFGPEGNVLGSIGPQGFEMDVTNAAFGGPNRTTLFVTTFSQSENGGLYSVELNVPGLPY